MGNILPFKTNKNTKKQLEDIQNDIDKIEEFKLYAMVREKNSIIFLIIVSVIIYLCGIGYLYFIFDRNNLNNLRVILALGFLALFPLAIHLLTKLIRKYFKWVQINNNLTLVTLIKLKKKILSKVQETETFNDAKIILEKYDPSALRNLSMSLSNLSHLDKLKETPQRPRFASTSSPQPRMAPRPSTSQARLPSPPTSNLASNFATAPMLATPASFSRTVKPILPQNRSAVEKMIDYMFGDGPSNRFALICLKCSSHNGMALPQEFEYISYICAYCGFFNPARKAKPTAPTIEMPKAIEAASSTTQSSDSSNVKIVEISSEINKDDSSTKLDQPQIEEIDDDNKSKEKDDGQVLNTQSEHTQSSTSQ